MHNALAIHHNSDICSALRLEDSTCRESYFQDIIFFSINIELQLSFNAERCANHSFPVKPYIRFWRDASFTYHFYSNAKAARTMNIKM